MSGGRRRSLSSGIDTLDRRRRRQPVVDHRRPSRPMRPTPDDADAASRRAAESAVDWLVDRQSWQSAWRSCCGCSSSSSSPSTASRCSSTLHSGDRVIVNKLSYDLHDPRHGDIVVLKDIKASLAGARSDQAGDRPARGDGRVPRLPAVHQRPAGHRAVPRSELVRTGHCGDSQVPVVVEPGPRLRDGRQPRRLARQPDDRDRPDPVRRL